MATEWEGKSRGNVLGYRIYIFFLKNLGIGTAYFVLRFIVLYFFLFSWKGSQAIYYYLHKRLGYSKLKSIFNVYKSYFVFGKVLTDKIAISSGLQDRYTFTFDGVEQIEALLAEKKGGILISAHIGNFEVSQYFLKALDSFSQINLVTTDAEHAGIKNYLDQVSSESRVKIILVEEDMTHIFKIHTALSNGELVVFTGDRYLAGTKHLTENFMGAAANFPIGPYLLASRLKVPVLFVYVMKASKRHYNFYARRAKVKARDPQALLKEYTESVEWILNKYPLQWFNYFDFWEALKK